MSECNYETSCGGQSYSSQCQPTSSTCPSTADRATTCAATCCGSSDCGCQSAAAACPSTADRAAATNCPSTAERVNYCCGSC